MKILLAALCLLNVISYISAQEISDAEMIKILGTIFSPNVKNTTGYEEVDDVEVATLLGNIKGKTVVTDDGTEMNTFLGIPYAQPPVGNLRFVPPRPVYGYKDFQAFSFGNSCPQKDEFEEGDVVYGDEDCLCLDIYDKVSNQTMLKPVMVWIHGGGFSIGSGAAYNPVSLIKEDVIVVNINYRLGALGFLNFGNDLAPGNLGLRDQIQALKWVKMMSIYFGGDPNRITIFGESAGAMSCHALTMSPKAYGLMSGAIYESGTLLLSKADLEKTKTHRAAARAAQHFNCSSSNYDLNMLECLQELTIDEIFSITSEITLGEAFFPIMDPFSSDPVNPVDYLTSMKNGQFNRIPIMTGTLKNDGGLFMPEDDYEEMWKAAGVDFLGLKSSFDYLETTKEEKLQTKLIKRYYTGDSTYLPDTIEEFIQMMTDALFLSPDQMTAELASQYVPVYNFRYTYAGAYSGLPLYLIERIQRGESIEAFKFLKPVHGDELPILFDMAPLNDDDLEVRKTMIKYWTNFAKYGHPSPLLKDNITQWLAYSSEKNIMILDAEATMDKNVEEERMTLWKKVHWNQRMSKIEEVNIFTRAYQSVLRLFRGY